MTVQGISCFLIVAETLSYTKAAERLYISQPAVSKHIATIEEELGAPLLDRTVRRAIRLTPAGEILYRCLRDCRTQYQDATRQIAELRDTIPVVVNLPEGISLPDRVFSIFDRFQAKYQQVLELSFIQHTQFAQVLEQGQFLICEKSTIPSGKHYTSHPIRGSEGHYLIIASERHPMFGDSEDLNRAAMLSTPLFLPRTMPPSVIQKYEEIVTKFLGQKPMLKLLDSIDTVILFLRAARGFTMGTSWHRGLLTAGNRSVEIPAKTKFCITWKTDEMANSASKELLEML